MAAIKPFTQQEADLIKATIRYNPEDGSFERLDLRLKTPEWRKVNLTPNQSRYCQLAFLIDNKVHKFYTHRIAYLLSTGELDFPVLDHINGIKTDNRLQNLRTATPTQNSGNQRRLGVRFHKLAKKWQVRLGINGKSTSLGYFNSKEEAIAVYRKAHAKYHKEFSPYYEDYREEILEGLAYGYS